MYNVVKTKIETIIQTPIEIEIPVKQLINSAFTPNK